MENNAVKNLAQVECDNTRELVKEMNNCLYGKGYPLYNAAMLLFRPILVHVLYDLTNESANHMNYEQIIKELDDKNIIDGEITKLAYEHKHISNEVNHNFEVLFDDQHFVAEEAYKIIKYIIENNY